MKLGDVTVPINWLIRPNWLESEMRVQLNEAKIRQYAEEMREGSTFPRPIVFIDPKTQKHWVADGFHRIRALKENGAKEVEVVLKRGSKLDACIAGIEANREQRGLPFSTGDKRRCIETLLQECSPQWSYAKLAQTVGSCQSYVSIVARKLYERGDAVRPENYENRDGRLRPFPKSQERFPEVTRSRLAHTKELLDAGNTIAEIASALGVSRQSACSYRSKVTETEVCPTCDGTGRVPKSTDGNHEQS